MSLYTSSTVRRLAAVAALVGLLASCDEDDPVAPPSPVLTTVSVNLSKESFEVGDTSIAVASGLDQGGAALATGTVAWSVRDAAIATIDADGRVIGLAAGNTVVAGNAGGVVGERAIAVTAPPEIIINEVESNGGTPGDWVELFNPGTAPVDIAGWGLKDNEDSRTFTFAAGTVIPAGGYLVAEEAQFGYGLGAADATRLYSRFGVLVASHEWTAHATTTYGRCPDATGPFVTTTTATKGAANNCDAPAIRINEVESNGGTPGDWIELYNAGTTAVDVSNFIVKDNDDSRTTRLPAGTTIAPGGFFVIEESLMGFGLGAPDAARIYDAAGTLVDSYEWTAHAAITYGRCPDATGPFVSLTTATKGAANDCRPLIRINEVESNGGTPGDWIELYNAGTTVVDVSNFIVKDNEDTRTTRLPAGTTIAPGGFFVIEESLMGFGLGAPDAARIYDAAGTLIDSYEWTAHAATTYGRCPDGSGTFVVTTTSTKGAVNICTPVGPVAAPWPGDDDVQTVGVAGFFGSNLSGLAYEAAAGAAPAYLWAVRNGPGTLYRLVQAAGVWSADAAANWGAGKALRYPDGTGDVDAEGVAFAGTAAGGMYVAAERNNSASGVSRNSILRFDVSGAATTLTAINEWNLTADLPVTGANLGLEAITWIPDADLVARQFFDASKGRAYAPADYANHGTGLFFVGVEADGMIYAYALDHVANTFTRVATITTGFPGVMALEYDGATGYLWAVCDDGCGGLTGLLEIDTGAGSPTHGRFLAPRRFARPPSMPNLNNEGFALTPASECVAGRRPVFWSDDAETGGHSLRRASMQCGVIAPGMAAIRR